MLNHIVIMGRFTRDPELRRTGSGIAVASFTVAVDRDFKSGTAMRRKSISSTVWRGARLVSSLANTSRRVAWLW